MYTQSITRTHRTAIILAIDGSGSMAEKIRFRNRQMTKAEAVATITNGMLFELIERARRSDGVRDYYDIAVIGYSGDDEVYSLLPGGRELISVAELAAGEPPMKTEVVEYRLPDGSISLREIPLPGMGGTRSRRADPDVRGPAPRARHRRGMVRRPGPCRKLPADGLQHHRRRGHRLRRRRTARRGRTDQIAPHGRRQRAAGEHPHRRGRHPRTVFFPSVEEASYPNRYAAVLYDCSSPMPEVFNEAIREAKGPGALPPFRGMSFNASAEELITMLNIGSISVKTE